MDKIINILQRKQGRLSRRYAEIEDAQGEFPHAYNAVQGELQRIDDINEYYRMAICNLESAVELERKVV